MQLKILLASLLAAAAMSAAAQEGDVIIVTGSARPPSTQSLPTKGMDKAAVARSYGEPAQRRAPVGGGSRRQPPITRWDYEGYSVFFENNHVIDTVQRGQPAEVRVREGLATGRP